VPQIFSVIVSIAAILMIGNILLISHELGHFLAARAVGLTAQRFTIGFGPNLLRLTDRYGTVWSFSALPVGGFVSFAGEGNPAHSNGYAALRPPARLAVIMAGPAANILLAIGLYAGILATQGETTLLPVASIVLPGSPAAAAGLQAGDQILAVDGVPVTTFSEVLPRLHCHPGQAITLTIRRAGYTLDLTPHLAARPAVHRTIGFLGIESHVLGNQPLSLWQIAVYAPARTWDVTAETVTGIATALTTGKGASHFTGILGVTQLAGEAAAASTVTLLALTAVLSVNLALMNLLPIPVLDGGAFLFCLIEWLRGRPAPTHVQDFATRVGAATIAGCFAFFILHDLSGFGALQWISKF
jgi:regulator of sigma E protease